MNETHADYLDAWTQFRNEEWDGCSHLDCLPACRHTIGNYYCERLEQEFAAWRSRQAPHSSSEGGR